MYPDFKELLSALNDHNVRYLVVGGYAVSFHAEPRATKDLDILIAADTKNSQAVYAALAKFGGPIEGLSPTDFAEPDNFFRMGTPPVMVDILPKISGVDFESAWQRRVDVPVDESLNVPFISREDLLAAKLAAARPQDLADAEALSRFCDSAQNTQESLHTPGENAREEIERRKAKGREEWLKIRQRQLESGKSLSHDEARAKGRQDSLEMSQSEHERSHAPERDLEDEHTHDSIDKDLAEGRGIDDDLDI